MTGRPLCGSEGYLRKPWQKSRLGLRSKLRPARETPKKGVCPACGRGYHEHFREPPVAGQHFHPLPLSVPQVSFRPVRPVLPDINGTVSDVMARVYTINRHVLRHHLTPPSLRVAMPDFDGILDRLPDLTNLKIPDIGKSYTQGRKRKGKR